ncbi:MAG TPA: chorismate-binding protein [Anaerolineae bacterium]|nr:chorismate-binding protein [Anaerolineae bacterium]
MYPFDKPVVNAANLDNGPSLAAFFAAAVAARLAVALWRQPGHVASQAVVDLGGPTQPAAIDFQSAELAFVFSPFFSEEGKQPLRIRADVMLHGDNLRVRQELWNGQRQRYETFLATYQDALGGRPQTAQRWHAPAQPNTPHSSDYVEYCRLVDSAIDFIVASGIKKVVVSRTAKTPLPAGFDPVATFQALCQRYPAAFVSLVAIPDVGTWIGASPELLVSTDSHALHTMALAGTQGRLAGRLLTAVRWNPKEIEEQALVSDYIRDFFSRAGAGVVHETGPRTVEAGNVLHLQSDFCVELPRPELMTLANRVLHELHPTSAVCGMPKDKALAFILQHEGYDRSFYSGYLGPVHIDGQSHLYVNLRCMQLGQDAAYLYMGGGVTADSSPDAEWCETELKAGTLLSVLQAGADAPSAPQPVFTSSAA